MVGFSNIVLGLSAAAATLAAPTAERGAANFVLHPDHPLARRIGNLTARSNPSYTQNYQTGGTVNFTPTGTGFTLNYNVQQDFVVGVGWNPGSNQPITHSGTFTVNSGLGSLSVYGWSTNPLVEYYIMEVNDGITVGGQQMGTVESDGGTYTIWKHQQVNQPAIAGSGLYTFWQYISIRDSPRTSGTVTVQNHFDAWAKLGMNLGTMNLQVVAVESWSGSGSAQQTVYNGGSGSTGGSGGGNGGSSGGSGGSTGTCSALWGQCGGQGWTGPTCCSQGTCKAQNQWYSQCLQ
ncbi:67ba8c36-572c-4107-9e82-f09fb7e2eaad [Thermothielavioides terrestris]|uniref:Endo-1,4-beta-xylanase n=1 Tax=Thermothielavioides terrestris TaxID=2587410 RepID=A0A3S4EX19_9PEZI|nr:67ba8c36-572c-4107-9e82-f09fb7e2eaad [Thermothielavioides terrestris]